MRDIGITKTASEDGNVIVTGTGELDLHIVNEFDMVLADAVASGGPVTVDFTGAYFIDSAILQSLAKYGKTIHDQGRRLKVLVEPGSHPEYVLKAVGFDMLMDIQLERR